MLKLCGGERDAGPSIRRRLFGIVIGLSAVGMVSGTGSVPEPIASKPAAVLDSEVLPQPRLIDVWGGAASALAIEGAGQVGDRVFLAHGPRIEAYPALPNHDGRVSMLARSDLLPGLVSRLAVDKDRVYAMVFGHGLWVLERDQLTTLARLVTLGSANDMLMVGDRLYLADGSAGLRVVDVADPASLRILSTIPMPDRNLPENTTSAQRLVHVGERLLVNYWDEYSAGDLVAIYELGAESGPSLAGIVELGELGAEAGPPACADPPAVILLDYRLLAIDACDAGSVRLVDSYQPLEYLVTAMAAKGDRVLLALEPQHRPGIADAPSGYSHLQVSANSGFREQGFLEAGRDFGVIGLGSASGDRGAAVEFADSGGMQLRWMDLAVSEGLRSLTTLPIFAPSVKDVVMSDDLVWTIVPEGFWRIGIESPQGFGPADRLSSPSLGNATALTRSGDVFFVPINGPYSLSILDASQQDMKLEKVLTDSPFDRQLADVAVRGEHLYAAVRARGTRVDPAPAGLAVFSLQSPRAPQPVASLSYEISHDVYDPRDLEIGQERAILRSMRSVHVVDISDPAALRVIAVQNIAAEDGDLTAATIDDLDRVYTATSKGVLDAYDSSQGGRLIHLARLPLDAKILGMTPTGSGVAVLTAGERPLAKGYTAQVHIIEHPESNLLVETTSVTLPGDPFMEPVRMATSGGRLTVAMRQYGLYLIDARPNLRWLHFPWLGMGMP